MMVKDEVAIDPKCSPEGSLPDRFGTRVRRVSKWAMLQDKEKLAHRFALLWALDKVTAQVNNALYRLDAADADMESDASELRALIADLQKSLRARGAVARWNNDPKSQAISEVKEKWLAMKSGASRYRSDAQFSREMMRDYGELLSEGGIKNAIVRWRRE